MVGNFRLIVAFLGLAGAGCDPADLFSGNNQTKTDEAERAEKNQDAEDERDFPDAEDGTCSAWKFAYCDAIVECSAFVTREECELNLGWLVCKEDAPLGSCQARIERAVEKEECDDLPEDCSAAQIADRTLATQLCKDIHVALCEHRLFCGLELSLDGCIETLARVEPCEEFTSFLPTAVDCTEAYSVLGCGEPMPEVCAGSLRR
jgi:hypothetical protein